MTNPGRTVLIIFVTDPKGLDSLEGGDNCASIRNETDNIEKRGGGGGNNSVDIYIVLNQNATIRRHDDASSPEDPVHCLIDRAKYPDYQTTRIFRYWTFEDLKNDGPKEILAEICAQETPSPTTPQPTTPQPTTPSPTDACQGVNCCIDNCGLNFNCAFECCWIDSCDAFDEPIQTQCMDACCSIVCLEPQGGGVDAHCLSECDGIRPTPQPTPKPTSTSPAPTCAKNDQTCFLDCEAKC